MLLIFTLLKHQNGTRIQLNNIKNARRLLATLDDERYVGSKNRYALTKNLGGIMFWQLYDDKFSGGLLDAIVGDVSEVDR